MIYAYSIMKIIHYFALISWCVGLLYLPRIFVYQQMVEAGSKQDKIFITMASRLRKIIMLPAFIILLIVGLMMATMGGFWQQGWFHTKLLLIVALLAYHMWLASIANKFKNFERPFKQRTLRIINEIPTVIILLIITLAVLRPF